jgi:uncharacterized HhH-GPD family protein
VSGLTHTKVIEINAFEFRWPDTVERFDHGWETAATTAEATFNIRHALATRIAYGRPRVRSVTWVNGDVAVEGVEADDYGNSRAPLSLIRVGDKKMVRRAEDIPADIRGLTIVNHRDEIDAPYSRSGLAVKIKEDDVASWAEFAVARMRLYDRLGTPGRPHPSKGASPAESVQEERNGSPLTVTGRSARSKQAIAQALLAYAASGSEMVVPGSELTTNPEADAFVRRDPLAFLIAVIFDQGIPYERAWSAPLQLQRRLGHLDPERLVADPESVRTAIQQVPKLHRFVENVPAWVVLAAKRVLDEYEGDAGRIWGDEPTARELQRRLTEFTGIGQKKAAMAVEILEREIGMPIREMEGSDIAYDIHVRRVFLRTGFADMDTMEHMVEVARTVNPDRPGALDEPAWRVGKNWCHPRNPDCPSCAIREQCARLIDRTIGLE